MESTIKTSIAAKKRSRSDCSTPTECESKKHKTAKTNQPLTIQKKQQQQQTILHKMTIVDEKYPDQKFKIENS